jgi:hypothetical protein
VILVAAPLSTPVSGGDGRPTTFSAEQVWLRKIFEHVAAKTPATEED